MTRLAEIPTSPTSSRSPMDTVTPAQWERLASRRLFFGHQSVGQNLVDGVAHLLAERGDIHVRIIQVDHLDGAAGPGLFHARLGTNGDPGSKIAAFAAALRRATGPLVALFKFCYVDVAPDTDPDRLLAAYQAGVEGVRRPGLTILHMTMPLTTSEDGPRALAKRLLGRHTNRQLNAIRHRYNELLLRAFASREPVFDLAAFESRRLDGQPSFFRAGPHNIPALAPDLTDDGGHLNPTAQRRAGELFLSFLAKLP